MESRHTNPTHSRSPRVDSVHVPHGVRKTELKSAKKKATPRWKRWLKRGALIILIGFITCSALGVGVFAWYAKDLPSPSQIEHRTLAESTKIFDRSGEHLLYETGKNVRRTYVTLDQISPFLINATVALEDKNFYQHRGFDPVAIIRTIWTDIKTGKKYGGSTITQQFVKQAVLTNEKKFDRKIKELILSIELERRYSKQQILEYYLNENPYGGINLGVEAAAQAYFNKSAKDISLAEAATLAAIPQAPSYYTDTTNAADLLKRRNYTLDRLVEENYATAAEVETAKQTELKLNKVLVQKDAPHFVDYVMQQLEDDFGGNFIDQGLKVTTTLDYNKQVIAQEEITKGMTIVEKYGGSNAALVTIDAKTGQVLTMVGSKNYYATDYEGEYNVTTSLNQPGSSFKPIVYLTAFANGYNSNTMIFDVETDFPIESGVYHPHNYDLSTHGPLPMRRTLAMSLNIPAVKTFYLAGKDKVIDTAESLGYGTFYDRSQIGLAAALGSNDVKLLEHAAAFATLAREGERHPTTTILKVEDRQNKILYEWQNNSSQAVDKTATQMLNAILSDPANRGGIFPGLVIPGKTLAAKTGTTNDFKDAWAMGYTPSFATGVWAGNNQGSVAMDKGADGSFVAAPIMISYMKRILEGLSDEKFSPMQTIKANKPVLQGAVGTTTQKYVDKNTKKLIKDECLAAYPAEYKIQQDFKEVHTILYYLTKEDPLGPAPTHPEKDTMFKSWETGVLGWASGQAAYLTSKTEYEDCNLHAANQTPTITIVYPASNTSITKAVFSIGAQINAGATGRTIKQVEYLIDNARVDIKTTAPFDSTYTGHSLTAGTHTLTVKATNDRNNIGTATIKFTIITESTNNNKSNTNTNKNTNTKNKVNGN